MNVVRAIRRLASLALTLAATVGILCLPGQHASAAPDRPDQSGTVRSEPGGTVQLRSQDPFMICYYRNGHLLWCDIYG